MGFARFVLHVANKDFLVCKPCRQFLCTRQQTAAIITNVDDELLAWSKIIENVVEIAGTNAISKRRHTYVAGVIVENTVFHARSDAVVGAEVL